MGGRSRAKEPGLTALGIGPETGGGGRGSAGCAEASLGGKSNCIQALPSSWPPLPSCKSGGASLCPAKSRRGIPGAPRED